MPEYTQVENALHKHFWGLKFSSEEWQTSSEVNDSDLENDKKFANCRLADLGKVLQNYGILEN